jgi:hypothetical protein
MRGLPAGRRRLHTGSRPRRCSHGGRAEEAARGRPRRWCLRRGTRRRARAWRPEEGAQGEGGGHAPGELWRRSGRRAGRRRPCEREREWKRARRDRRATVYRIKARRRDLRRRARRQDLWRQAWRHGSWCRALSHISAKLAAMLVWGLGPQRHGSRRCPAGSKFVNMFSRGCKYEFFS